MAKLLTEIFDDVQYITEAADAGKKKYAIEGIFAQAEQVNRNSRIYPKALMEREINAYVKNYVNERKALGELSHPTARVNIDPERASHLITSLKINENNVYGKAVILDTPPGKILKAFIDEGVKWGVSTRALGSVKTRTDGIHIVQDDFQLKCIDAVTDPSAHAAWVTAINESAEWIYVDGRYEEQQIESAQRIIRKATQKELNEVILSQFNIFIKSL
jgi:hypothetical protein